MACASPVPRPGGCGRSGLPDASAFLGARSPPRPASPASLCRCPRLPWLPAARGRWPRQPGKLSWSRLARDLSSLGKGSWPLSMPSHVPGQVAEYKSCRGWGKRRCQKTSRNISCYCGKSSLCPRPNFRIFTGLGSIGGKRRHWNDAVLWEMLD